MNKPTTNPITLPFGSTEAPYSPSNPHKGTDFSYKPDKTIYMPADAVVTLIPNNGNDGNGVYFTAEGYQVGLLHTSQYLVQSGQFVKQGTPVAIMGDTGYAQGIHCHWAVKKNGQFIDPMSTIMGGDDMLTEDEFYNCYRGMMGKDPTQEEAKSLTREAGLLIRTLFNNGSRARYEADRDGAAQGNYKDAGSVDGKPVYRKA